jgi:hypothetical protein
VTEPASSPARRCIKCGREVGPDESMCEVCNRAGMVPPSATQYHGTIVLAIVAGIAGLAIAATLATQGVGPFTAETLSVGPLSEGAVEVSVRVVNQGTQAGTANCRIIARDGNGRPLRTRTALVRVEAGGTTTVTERLTGLPSSPADVTAVCS